MKIPYLNYSAIVLLVSLMLIVFTKSKNTYTKSTVLFLVNLAVNILSALFSSIYLHYDNLGPGNLIPKYIFHSLYLLFHNLAVVGYFFYLISFSDDWEHFFKSKLKIVSLFLPITIITVIIFANCFTPIIFYFNEADRYTRIWKCFFILYVSTIFYLIYSFIYLLLHRQLYTKGQFVTTFVVFPILVFSVILEIMTKHLVVESFFDAIAILFVAVNIQRSEETLNIVTGFFNSGTYLMDMKKITTNQKHVVQILINITNYENVLDMIGQKNREIFLKECSKKIIAESKKFKLKSVNYYNGSGNFRLVYNIKKYDEVLMLAEEFNKIFNEVQCFKDFKVNIITNVCIERNPDDIADLDTILIFGREINDAKYYTGNVLYAHKIYTNDYYQKLRNIDQILEEALTQKKFQVYYQPIYSIKEKKFNSAEALLRLKDEKYGFISPDFFIPAAEQSGLIFKITDYVLDEVCKFISSDEFKELGIDYIEVNLSAAECMQNNLTGRILAILDKNKVDCSKINIEITETALTRSEEQLINNVEKLYSAGIKLSLDDFGSGYSNLQRLTFIPLEIVKFDKSFITNIKDQATKNIMFSNIGKMIHDMNIHFLVEGVETLEALKYFESINCDYVQGYYFSKPIPKTAFIEFIKNNPFLK